LTACLLARARQLSNGWNEEADEVCQQARLQFHEAYPTADPLTDVRMRRTLFRILNNVHLDRWRRRKTAQDKFDALTQNQRAIGPDPHHQLDRESLPLRGDWGDPSARLGAALSDRGVPPHRWRGLPDDKKSLLIDRHVHDLRYNEIADLTGVQADQLRVRHQRIVKTIRGPADLPSAGR